MDRWLHSAWRIPLGAQRVVLPLVTLLLLVGATFLALAWDGARDAWRESDRKDTQRAERNAEAVSDVVGRTWDNLEAWRDANAELFRPGREPALQLQLGEALRSEASSAIVGWVVVRSDGSIAAIDQRGALAAAGQGAVDDVVAFGRQVASRGTPLASDAIPIADEPAFAVGVPVKDLAGGATGDGAGDGFGDGAVVSVYVVGLTSISSFLPEHVPDEADAVVLRDGRRRLLAGDEIADGMDVVERPVPGTAWTIQLPHDVNSTLLPLWSYPAFAALLVVLAIGYAVQEGASRRFRVESDERVRQVRTLYELASLVLHAGSMREQAEELARCALDLVQLDGARVRLAADDDRTGIVAGSAVPGQREYRVAVTGPRMPVGELVAYRRDRPLDVEERSALQTAATLVGAAIHTRESLEAERAAAAELQRLDELRSNLLATVAHELRSPLTAVKGVLGLLAMQEDIVERTRQYVDVATERTDSLSALIDDLFDCSLLETGQLDIRPQRQLASELLESALGAQAAAHPGDLLLDATPNLMITVDPVRFDQLVNNLVTNAFRHGAPPIEVLVRPGEHGAVVIVTDEGPGIPPADREHIFGKFWQGSSGHARLVEGAGIGLNLVQGLVRLHGGRVDIDTVHADGRGARFTATFPDVVPDRHPGARRAPVPPSGAADELGPEPAISGG